MRRRLAVGLATAVAIVLSGTLVSTPAEIAIPTDHPPRAGTYNGWSSKGHRVTFSIYTIDLNTARQFSVEHVTIFTEARLHHVSAEGGSTWSFHGRNAHYDVHGHTNTPTSFHGSLCNLHTHPSGCTHEQLETYVADLKTAQ
jgi:hypothetical protein